MGFFHDHDHDAVHYAVTQPSGFELTPEQLMLRDLARDIAQKELAPRAAQVDKEGSFPWEGIAKLAEAGMTGLVIPQLYGGTMGLRGAVADSLAYAVAVEEIAQGCASTALIFVTHTVASYAIVQGGDVNCRAHYLPDLAQGGKLAAFAVTEAGSGANALAIQTSARREDDHYIVQGSKTFITSAGEADVYVTLVRTAPGPGPAGLTLLVIDKDSPGLSFGRKDDRMGFRGVSSGEVVFDGCRVPRENLLGEEGGYIQQMPGIMGIALIGAGALAVGLAQAALEASIHYVRERVIAGQPLAAYQGVQFAIAEMATEVAAARSLLWKATFERDQNPISPPLEAFKAKLFATQMALRVTEMALQLHGGTGYTRELPLERYYRDARGLALHFGPTEALKDSLGKMLLGLMPGAPAPAHPHPH